MSLPLLLISSCALVIAFMVFIFIIAQLKKNMTLVDVAWGSGFILVALFSFFASGLFLARHILITLLTLIWGVRLSSHIAARSLGKQEDSRYAQLRAQWGTHVAIHSFFKVFMLQALLLMMIALPIIIVNGSTQSGLTALDYSGLCIWIVGFLFEAIGDYQLKRFISNPKNKGAIMDQGLWRYTRHPNYFGEVTLWWGMFIIGLSVSYGWIGIISPLTITTLLLGISGIPMTEKQFEHNPAYQAYKRRTSAFFPWLPK